MTLRVGRTSKDEDQPGRAADDGRAVYASRPTRGRVYKEDPSRTRGDFERDRDRIIHSTAFRRLKFKTQVFVYYEGDHYRTRLSHSIEVAQVARSLARALKVDEDLAETCALAHDLGHTPFAHSGENALAECMAPYGGFDHNDQTLRVVTKLERKYPKFDGLNLTWETLEGLVKHHGPVVVKGKKKKFEATLDELRKQVDLMLDTHASLEAQIAAIADDIAYNSHDIDDGFTAGYLSPSDLDQVDWVGEIVRKKRRAFPGIDDYVLGQEVIRDVMGTYIADVLDETRRRLAALKPGSADDIRHAGHQMVEMSKVMKKKDAALRAFLWSNLYRHHEVNRMGFKAYRIVQDLFGAFLAHRKCLPPAWLAQCGAPPKGWTPEDWHARTVADYIASMTDRLAIEEHAELFDTQGTMR
jgi:dGTPase